MTNATHILHDCRTGKISNTLFHEKLGTLIARLSGNILKHISYVGFSKIAKLISIFLPSKKPIRTVLNANSMFEYPYGDQYWGMLIASNGEYSREEQDFLKSCHDIDYAFIDCGANYGFMSVLVTSDEYGNKPSFAIEADPNTFKHLKHNAQLNDDRFKINHRAVFSKSGELVNIHGNKHEARSILNDEGKSTSGNVETLALNDVKPWIKKQKAQKVILKLDVEGVEIDALKGADKLLEEDILIMFEDHGNDTSNETSRYFMEVLGMQVYYSDTHGCRQLTSLDDVMKLKRNPRVGYDLIATKSDFWLKHIHSVKYI